MTRIHLELIGGRKMGKTLLIIGTAISAVGLIAGACYVGNAQSNIPSEPPRQPSSSLTFTTQPKDEILAVESEVAYTICPNVYPLSNTWSTGVPNTAFWKLVQCNASNEIGGYTGAIDGIMGINSWKGVQVMLNHMGFGPTTLVVDGIPGPATNKALQYLAHYRGGYTGAYDGILGPASYKALGSWANTAGID